LQDYYSFYEVELLNVQCLLMVDRNRPEQSPAVIRKHMKKVQDKWAGKIVYIRERVTSYNRKRLIEQKLPFVVPGNQMYLPMLGMDLREHFRNIRIELKRFKPSTQALFIYYILYCSPGTEITPTELAGGLRYTTMTMSRAFDELEDSGLVDITERGRERFLRFRESKRDTWEKAQQFLRSPVRKRQLIAPLHMDCQWPRAGMTALAHYTMLSAPKIAVFALRNEEWKLLEQQKVAKPAIREPGSYEVEIWKYAPTMFSKDGLVDPLSLYLSIKDSTEGLDERVEIALDELLEGVLW